MSVIDKIKKGAYTDEDRKELRADSAKFLRGSLVDMDEVAKEISREGTKQEKEAFETTAKFFDGIYPYYVAHNKHMPAVSDVRLAAYGAVIGYVNSGADDFNNAEPSHMLCPSIMVAAAFERYVLCVMESWAKDLPLSKNEQNSVNDLLYIYAQLKKSPKGLNKEMIAKHDKKHKDKTAEILKVMDEWLKVPEKERFNPKPQPAPEKSKKAVRGLFSRR